MRRDLSLLSPASILRAVVGVFLLYIQTIVIVIVLYLLLPPLILWVPYGVDAIPYSFFSVDRGTVQSPDGAHEISIRIADAGATQSGACWLWATRRTFFGFPYVIAEGYVESSRGEIPIEWIDDDTCRFTFLEDRHAWMPTRSVVYRFWW